MKVCPNCGCILEPPQSSQRLTDIQQHTAGVLTDFGVQPGVAQALAAGGVHPTIARAWIAYARKARLYNPPGLVVAKLRAREEPPLVKTVVCPVCHVRPCMCEPNEKGEPCAQ